LPRRIKSCLAWHQPVSGKPRRWTLVSHSVVSAGKQSTITV